MRMNLYLCNLMFFQLNYERAGIYERKKKLLAIKF